MRGLALPLMYWLDIGWSCARCTIQMLWTARSLEKLNKGYDVCFMSFTKWIAEYPWQK